MLPLYFLAVLLVQAQAAFTCPKEIKTVILEDYDQMIGNWTFAFHWVSITYDYEEHEVQPLCGKIEITKATEKYIQDKKDSCKTKVDFNWDNIKYKVVSPELLIDNSIIIDGEGRAMMETHGITASLELRKIADDYIIMINKDRVMSVQMLAKKTPSWKELECLHYGLDITGDLYGEAICWE